MEAKRIILGGIVLFLVFAGVVLFIRSKTLNKNLALTSNPTPTSTSKLESRFNLQTSPTGRKINLVSIGVEGEAVALRDFRDGHFTQTIVANLAEPNSNEFYQAWIERGNEGQSNYNLIPLGKLTMEKGGFILDYESHTDYSDYKKVTVSKEVKDDGKMETKVLEGSFN